MAWCSYQTKQTGIFSDGALPIIGRPVYGCQHDGHREAIFRNCLRCDDFTSSSAKPAGHPKRHPPNVFCDRYGNHAPLADLYRGAGCFLILAGPSLKELPLELLKKRGVITMTINNGVAAFPEGVRPHLWTFTDKPQKFHDSIWKDPGILKFCSTRLWERQLDTRDGLEFKPLGLKPSEMPGTFYYARNTEFDPDAWLFEPSINRGNGKKGHAKNGLPRTINTMFTAVRILFYLGFSRVYLCGCDFRMETDAVYAFDETKHAGGCRSNNSAYANMNTMFDMLVPSFQKAAFEVINVTPRSLCNSFPRGDFTEAIERETHHIEQEMNTNGWYNHTPD